MTPQQGALWKYLDTQLSIDFEYTGPNSEPVTNTGTKDRKLYPRVFSDFFSGFVIVIHVEESHLEVWEESAWYFCLIQQILHPSLIALPPLTEVPNIALCLQFSESGMTLYSWRGGHVYHRCGSPEEWKGSQERLIVLRFFISLACVGYRQVFDQVGS